MLLIARTKNAQQSRIAQTRLNADVRLGDIRTEPQDDGFSCCACGKHYTKKKGNAVISHSPLFAGNNGFVPLCKDCMLAYWRTLESFYDGNEAKAIDRMAQLFDWYMNDNILDVAMKGGNGASQLPSLYAARMSIPAYKKRGSTYLDTVKDRASDIISDVEGLSETPEAEKPSEAQISTWGLGYTPDEYKMLDYHYETLRTQVEDDSDVAQDELLRTLCTMKIFQSRAISSGDAETYTKLSSSYQSTLKNANLIKVRQQSGPQTSSAVCWGTTVKDIEEFCPASIYKEKKLFDDIDYVRDYFNRFVTRPIKNFFLGTRELDDEYAIHDSGDTP